MNSPLMKQIWRYALYIFAFIGFFLVAGYFAVRFGLTNVSGIVDNQRNTFLQTGEKPVWANSEEWMVFKEAVVKDIADIDRAANISGVSSRLIVANLMTEQLRLFYSDREIFKNAFAPLKMLGNQSQFSWGVMGLKQDTAKEIEANLKNKNSPYYLGEKFENLLDFKTDNHDQERFERITDEHSRFYSYLYTGIYLRQITEQWKHAGFDISGRPEILSTLFNIGFIHSVPKANPDSGGAELNITGKTYSFGGLAKEFYYSDELKNEFPK